MVYSQVQYVHFNTFGNTARKIVPAPVEKKAVLPKPVKAKRKVIYVDPVAFMSIVVAFCMVMTMTIGIFAFASARREATQMEAYVAQLATRNAELDEQYKSGYDIRQVEESALALGMVTRDQVQTLSISVTAPYEVQTVTLWDQIGTFLTTIFA